MSVADLLGSALSQVDSLVDGGLVQRVTIDSAVTPRFELTRPLADLGPAAAPVFDWGSIFRPSVKIELAGGQAFTFEPYGPPSQGLGELAGVGALVVLGLAIYGAITLTRRFKA